MRHITRILLVLILLVPLLWVWPQRGVTVTFYPNRGWVKPWLVRVEKQISLDFMNADSTSWPQQDFTVEWSGWLRTDRDGQYGFATRSDKTSTLEIDRQVVVDNGGGVSPTATLALRPGRLCLEAVGRRITGDRLTGPPV